MAILDTDTPKHYEPNNIASFEAFRKKAFLMREIAPAQLAVGTVTRLAAELVELEQRQREASDHMHDAEAVLRRSAEYAGQLLVLEHEVGSEFQLGERTYKVVSSRHTGHAPIVVESETSAFYSSLEEAPEGTHTANRDDHVRLLTDFEQQLDLEQAAS